MECARESSSRSPIAFDAAGDNFKIAHIFLRDRGDHCAVYCETQVLGIVETLIPRELSEVELVVFNAHRSRESSCEQWREIGRAAGRVQQRSVQQVCTKQRRLASCTRSASPGVR